VRANEKLTAFLELESMIRACVAASGCQQPREAHVYQTYQEVSR
jgi:hypothetical protein